MANKKKVRIKVKVKRKTSGNKPNKPVVKVKQGKPKPTAKRPITKRKANKTPANKEITDLQKRFCDEYLIDLNGSAAYKRAGYKATGNSAESGASALLRNPKVRKYLKKRMDDRSKRTGITQDQVLQEMARIGFSDVRSLMAWEEDRVRLVPSQGLTEEQSRAVKAINMHIQLERIPDGQGGTRAVIRSVNAKVMMHDKQSALRDMARHLGMFDKDKIEVDHKGGLFVLPKDVDIDEWMEEYGSNGMLDLDKED